MFTKCQIIHIDTLKPNSVESSSLLLNLLTSLIVYHAEKRISDHAYNLSDVYCNLRNINLQLDHPVSQEALMLVGTPEYFSISQPIQQFVGGIIDSFYLVKQSDPTKQLNIGIALLTRHNLAITYDVF